MIDRPHRRIAGHAHRANLAIETITEAAFCGMAMVCRSLRFPVRGMALGRRGRNRLAYGIDLLFAGGWGGTARLAAPAATPRAPSRRISVIPWLGRVVKIFLAVVDHSRPGNCAA
jgi:hypothetical protein